MFAAIKNNPIVYLFMQMWRFAEGNRKNVVLYMCMMVVAQLIIFLEPLLIGFIMNTIQEQGINAANIWYLIGLCACILGIYSVFWLFHGPARIIENRNAFLVKAKYKQFLVDGVLSLPAKWHTDQHSGDVIDKINKGSEALFEYSWQIFFLIQFAVGYISAYITLAYFNIHAAYLVVIFSILAALNVAFFDKSLRKKWSEINHDENKISEKIFDVVSNITTVIILRLEKLVSKEIFKKIMKPYDVYMRQNKKNELKWFLVATCANLMLTSVFVTYILKIFWNNEVIMVGTFFTLYRYIQSVNNVFFQMTWRYSQIVRWKTNFENSEELSNDFISKQEYKAVSLNTNWKKVFIKDLNFSYHSDEGELHLRHVSLSISNGEKIALIGESGSGKTTFMKLIRSLYQPKDVEMYLDEKKLKDGFNSISKDITLLPQDPELFTATILENITMGIRHKFDYVMKFTDMAVFTKVANNLPHKFQSNIVEKGVNLSGGEKQRLALARGLLAAAEKPMLLMDEPTSSVDSKTEMQIYDNIFRKFRKKTIISSVHRLHLLKKFDMIYMFKKGRIVAHGSLDDLKKQSPDFQNIWKKYGNLK